MGIKSMAKVYGKSDTALSKLASNLRRVLAGLKNATIGLPRRVGNMIGITGRLSAPLVGLAVLVFAYNLLMGLY